MKRNTDPNPRTESPFVQVKLELLRVHGHIVAVIHDIGHPSHSRIVSLIGQWIAEADYAETVLREHVPPGLSAAQTVARAAEVLDTLADSGAGVYRGAEALRP